MASESPGLRDAVPCQVHSSEQRGYGPHLIKDQFNAELYVPCRPGFEVGAYVDDLVSAPLASGAMESTTYERLFPSIEAALGILCNVGQSK